jgi:hypothetical protein
MLRNQHDDTFRVLELIEDGDRPLPASVFATANDRIEGRAALHPMMHRAHHKS